MPFENADDYFSIRSSHFEKKWFMDEIMTSTFSYHGRFTQMTLSMAKDSGFYDADLSLGEHFYFNKNQGCKAYTFKHDCPTDLQDYCNMDNQKFCNSNHDYRTKCNMEGFVDTNCGVNQNIDYCKDDFESDDPLATYGASSKCGVFMVIIIIIIIIIIYMIFLEIQILHTSTDNIYQANS